MKVQSSSLERLTYLCSNVSVLNTGRASKASLKQTIESEIANDQLTQSCYHWHYVTSHRNGGAAKTQSLAIFKSTTQLCARRNFCRRDGAKTPHANIKYIVHFSMCSKCYTFHICDRNNSSSDAWNSRLTPAYHVQVPTQRFSYQAPFDPFYLTLCQHAHHVSSWRHRQCWHKFQFDC